MHNIDDVARHLLKTPFDDVCKAVFNYCYSDVDRCSSMPNSTIFISKQFSEFLGSHQWTVAELREATRNNDIILPGGSMFWSTAWRLYDGCRQHAVTYISG